MGGGDGAELREAGKCRKIALVIGSIGCLRLLGFGWGNAMLFVNMLLLGILPVRMWECWFFPIEFLQ
jgi:hypothetical protein